MKKPTTTGPNGVFSYFADIMGLTIAEKLLFVSTLGLYSTLKLDNYLKPEAVLLPREEVTAEPRGRARYCRTALCVLEKTKAGAEQSCGGREDGRESREPIGPAHRAGVA